MDAKRAFIIGIAATFLLSLAASSLAVYVMIEGDPFGGGGDVGSGAIPDKDPQSESTGVPASADGGLPGYVLPVSILGLLSAMAFLLLSGRVYMRSNKGENIVRMDLLDLITVNPGINLTSIRKELELSQGAVSYHIMKLEKSGKIFSDKGSKERRYYPSSMGYTNAMKMARRDEMESILSNETSARIVELLREGSKSQNELVKTLGISPSTVHWHMERMRSASMVRKEQRGRSVYYELLDLSDLNT
ncbi:MAG: hypothetical protein DRN37_05945 [Thermoplasmata archaeon]|nr:MAG: hypothetical protein B6U90_03285 [Thermoplasmatales archaeon ex4484_6]RLF57772.1 MAG: hypothetical protein DRN37_05945 [Thermoplasmata archaeon]RLF69596.1 MAG: hypothetical protein DRN57_00225 [Thermoplasmata archaeon]